MLCGFTCLILNCVLHLKIDLFRIGISVKIEEPTVLVINMFSAPSLNLKPIMSTLLYWAMIQTVGFILFQVKAFWFGWRSIDVRPIDFALLAHFAFLEHLAHIYRWQIHVKELYIYICICQGMLLLAHPHYYRAKFMTVRYNQVCPSRSVRALLYASLKKTP